MIEMDISELMTLEGSLASLSHVISSEEPEVEGLRTPADVRGVSRPRLICSIPTELNQFVDSASDHTFEWAFKCGIIQSAEERLERFIKARFSWLAAHSYPKVSEEQLKLISDWITFLFCYDDMCDTMAVSGEHYRQELARTEKRLVEIIRGARLHNDDAWLTLALYDIRVRASAMRSSGGWMRRLAINFAQYVEGVRWERLIRLRNETPSFATYSKLRLLTSAVLPCFDFAGMCIPALVSETTEIAYIRQLEIMANNYICWVNDVFGLEKEIREGNTCNMVLVLRKKYQVTLSDAVERAIDLCNDEFRAFMKLERDFSFMRAPDEPVFRYILALRSWMRGNLDWYAETKRYARASATDESPSSCWNVAARKSYVGGGVSDP